MTIKIDMSKAYDRVEWDMVISMMEKIGFSQKWRSWIREYISSVKYRVLVNGSLGKEIIPFRGLRQGDPLSHFLFFLCVEGLSASLINLERTHKISGIKINRSSPIISHLLFADDCYIFSKVIPKEIEEINSCLLKFSEASGQTINNDKSEVIFSQNTPKQFKSRALNILKIK